MTRPDVLPWYRVKLLEDEKMRWLLGLIVVAVISTVHPAQAQDVSSLSIPSALRVTGVVTQQTSTSLVMSCGSGLVNVPLACLQSPVRPIIGANLTVVIAPLSGTLRTCNDTLTEVVTSHGVCALPTSLVPPSTMQGGKVYVRKPKGKVVYVPLNAALNMQRAQGATILCGAPGRVDTFGIGDGPGNGNGKHGNGNGNGKGNGRGRGR